MPTAKVTKNVSAATGGGNVLCSTLISIKTKAWLYSFGSNVCTHLQVFPKVQLYIPMYIHDIPGGVCIISVYILIYIKCATIIQIIGRNIIYSSFTSSANINIITSH